MLCGRRRSGPVNIHCALTSTATMDENTQKLATALATYIEAMGKVQRASESENPDATIDALQVLDSATGSLMTALEPVLATFAEPLRLALTAILTFASSAHLLTGVSATS